MDLKEIAIKVHEQSMKSGFYPDPQNFNVGEKLMLIVSEITELLEADRENRRTESNISAVLGWTSDFDFQQAFTARVKDTFEDELADVIIRVLDLAEAKGVDIQTHVLAKMRFNSLREHKHGKKY